TRELIRQLINGRPKCPARPTPGGPEVHKHGRLALDYLVFPVRCGELFYVRTRHSYLPFCTWRPRPDAEARRWLVIAVCPSGLSYGAPVTRGNAPAAAFHTVELDGQAARK